LALSAQTPTLPTPHYLAAKDLGVGTAVDSVLGTVALNFVDVDGIEKLAAGAIIAENKAAILRQVELPAQSERRESGTADTGTHPYSTGETTLSLKVALFIDIVVERDGHGSLGVELEDPGCVLPPGALRPGFFNFCRSLKLRKGGCAEGGEGCEDLLLLVLYLMDLQVSMHTAANCILASYTTS
jgi:hypothetical protein